MRPVSRGKSRRSLVGCATCRKTPISWSAIDKIPMPGHLFEGNPVDEGTTRRGTDTPVHRPPKPQVPHTTRQVACHPVNNSRGKRSSITPHKTRSDSPVPTLQGPCYPSQKWRGTLTLLPQSEIRSSSIAPVPVMSREAPLNSTVSLTSQRHPENLPEVTGTYIVLGDRCFDEIIPITKRVTKISWVLTLHLNALYTVAQLIFSTMGTVFIPISQTGKHTGGEVPQIGRAHV